jgi:hypothetical protein
MGSHANHLSPSEFNALKKQAVRPSCTVPLAVIPATGLYPVEFTHLHDDWIEWPTDNPHTPDHPIIRIPRSDPCRRKKIKRGTGGAPILLPRSEPCQICRDSKVQRFTDPYRNDDNRVIPITDNYAVDQLTHWFAQHNTIPWDRSLTTLNKLSKKALGRHVSLRDLRFTFAARAAEMGFDIGFIQDRMGLSATTSALRRVLDEHGNQLQHSFQDYIQLLDVHEPLSPQQISEYLGLEWKSVCHRLQEYSDDGLVAKVSESGKNTPTYWTNVVPPGYTIKCSHSDCSKRFKTHSGRATHETIHCDSD